MSALDAVANVLGGAGIALRVAGKALSGGAIALSTAGQTIVARWATNTADTARSCT